MTFLSDFVGKTVVDVNEAPLGVIEEVIARAQGRVCGPRITALVVQQEGVTSILSTLDLNRITGDQVHLRCKNSEALKHVPAKWEIHLMRDFLGRQVIDFTHANAGRINDVKMEWYDGALLLTHIDIGAKETESESDSARIPWPAERRFRRGRVRSLILWKDFELLPRQEEKLQRYEITQVVPQASILDEALAVSD